MCEHRNDPGGREAAMTVIRPGVHCDPCLAPIVKALDESDLPTVPSRHNPDGIRTIGSCCGHGKQPANVALADGRQVFVADPEWAEAIWAAIASKRDGSPSKLIAQRNEARAERDELARQLRELERRAVQ